MFLTVGALIDELLHYPRSHTIHLDVSMLRDGWEGDRVVRYCTGVREQAGYPAVALDGSLKSA